MNASAHISRGVALAAVLAAGAAGCGSQGAAEKSGAVSDRPVTLRLEMPDAGDKLGAAFAGAVTRRSGGTVRVTIGHGYSSVVPANEMRLAQALEAGRADFAYIPARAWSAAGIPAFRALLAPFVVTTDAAAQALASGQIARDVLSALPEDVVGLGLVPDESRRVLAVRRALSPADFNGLRIRINDDPQTAATFQALGATPVQGVTATGATTQLERRAIDGVESAPTPILNNGYGSHAHELSGYAMFPKFQSIVISRAAWDRLSAKQQAALREAAQDAVGSAPQSIAAEERFELSLLCRSGTRISVPTQLQLQALAAATQPAISPLMTDKRATRVLEAMRELPGAGPQPLASPLPADCAAASRTKQSRTKDTGAAFPEGTYAVTVTPAMFARTGADRPKFLKTWTLTTRFRDGRWTQLVKPEFPDECPATPRPSFPPCGGTYDINGDELTLNWLQPPGPSETMKWSYFDGVLRFQPVEVFDDAERAIIGQPWRKVG